MRDERTWRIGRWCARVWQDLCQGLRTLARSPAFTAAAVAMLAVGIGVNVAVFSIANAVLFKGFRGVAGNDRLLYIGTQRDARGGGCCASYPDYEDWRAQVTSFEDLGAVADLRITYDDQRGSPESTNATRITANTFHILRQGPMLGRDFTPADEAPGAPPVAILSNRLWQRRYARDPAVVGQVVRINGTPTTVIGVMPEGFAFPQNQSLWLPLVPTPEFRARDARLLWFAFGRLSDGVTRERARTELMAIGRRLAAAYPATNEGWVPHERDFPEFFIGLHARQLYLSLWCAVGLVLLIACANLANLLLARAFGRSREMAIRLAVGAGRSRIAGQVLVETTMLSALGGCVGWWVARWAVAAYALVANPPTLSWSEHLVDYTMDARSVGYLVVMSVVSGLAFGLAPAIRLATLDVHAALRDGGRSLTPGRRRRHVSGVLVTTELALAVVLLTGAGLMVRTFLKLYSADLGIRPARVVAALMLLPEERYPTIDAASSFYERLTPRLDALSGVESVAIASTIPTSRSLKLPYETHGRVPGDARDAPTTSVVVVSPRYFATLGALVLAGRDFEASDRTGTRPVAIVNQRFVDEHWPGRRGIGEEIRLGDAEAPGARLTVVGVVSNIVQDDPTRQSFEPLVYVPYAQRPVSSMWVFVRTRAGAGALGESFRREVVAIDPALPVWLGPFPMEERLAGMGAYWQTGNQAVLFLVFAAIALVLACGGLYGVVAQTVSRRTQEIGVRMAMGATTWSVLGLVMRQGMLPAGAGLVLGLIGSFAMTGLLRSALVNVSPFDPATFAIVSVVLALAAALGCLVPARRAMRVDPVVALRHE